MDKAGSSSAFILLNAVFHVHKSERCVTKMGTFEIPAGSEQGDHGKNHGHSATGLSCVPPVCPADFFHSKTAIVMVTEGRPGRRSPVCPLQSKNNI